ncbi:hypothetical protein B0I35DRAFT_137397 [Stachybotrys elegans]|uniref:RNB domain-containing protein n=1 Tax=Stachybotrys elegans TaxID=80388 RepID=A0A8K0WWH3_9HYPO|nr:hypothetical protein B0I35DRAFT_137397 [Stachybotrys elegans]
MLQSRARPLLCSQCLARSSPRLAVRNPEIRLRSWISLPRGSCVAQRRLTTASTTSHRANSPTQVVEPRQSSRVPIRDQLLEWEKGFTKEQAKALYAPDVSFSYLLNDIGRDESTDDPNNDEFITLNLTASNAADSPFVGEDADISVSTPRRSPGDLVEFKPRGVRNPVLAIYLGFFGQRHHFFTVAGRWMASMAYSPLFSVSNFVDSAELSSVLSKIPSNGDPMLFEKMRLTRVGPSRVDGANLVDKMVEFRTASELLQQSKLHKLDRAQSLLEDPTSRRYMSLFDMVATFFPEYKNHEEVPPQVLYAIHSALSRDELGFHPLGPSRDCHRRDHIYEILPKRQIKLIEKVGLLTREYAYLSALNGRVPQAKDVANTTLGIFLQEARERVRHSRKIRTWTPHGFVYHADSGSIPRLMWSGNAQHIVLFLKWWASNDLFDPRSRFHASGALILRATGLYGDGPFDQTTAWTFLQELGLIPPWEVPSRYKIRFPDTGIIPGGGLRRKVPEDIGESRRPDIAADSRRDFGDSPVFCIDAKTTTLIDDGISLERTEHPDEFWIHIHVADPASGIEPNSELRSFMETLPDNIYLPGHFSAMLPSDLGKGSSPDAQASGRSIADEYSLRPDGPALTFSARVNQSGDILDYKLEPSILRNIVYMEPQRVSEFCNEPLPLVDNRTLLTTGAPPEPTDAPERPMIAPHALDPASQEDLLQLSKLGEALRQRRLSKGAWPTFPPQPSVKVEFHKPPAEAAKDVDVIPIAAPPYIQIAYDTVACSVVSNAMVLAGEIAARWCSSRGIPIPYRRDVNLGESHNEAMKLMTEELLPKYKDGSTASSRADINRLLALTGGSEASLTPGPFFILGLDMYAKATSPLRRFADTIVHWQIHAALAHERQTGAPIEAYTDDMGILPFTSASLQDMLPMLQIREKMARALNQSVYDWILHALARAWRFEGTAPKSFIFTVDARVSGTLLGRLDFCDVKALLPPAHLNDLTLYADVKTGDRFEVQLSQINVHTREVTVEALSYLKDDANPPPPLPVASATAHA